MKIALNKNYILASTAFKGHDMEQGLHERSWHFIYLDTFICTTF